MAVCPRCGSKNFRYELRAAGTNSKTNYYRTGIKNSWILPAGKKAYRSQRKQKSVGICRDCGYTEEKQGQEKGCLFYCFYYLLCLMVLPIILSVWFFKTDLIQLDKKWKSLIIAAFWVLLVVIVGSTSSNETDSEATIVTNEVASIWSSEYTELSDFDYYIDNNSIFLKKYNGRSPKVNIAPTYDVDGDIMPVVALDGTFALKSVDSVIVPEGITQIANNTFNSCGVENLYLPATLADFSGWTYFYDVQKLYYGGTEEQWNTLCTWERSRLDVVRIICDADIVALLDSTESVE